MIYNRGDVLIAIFLLFAQLAHSQQEVRRYQDFIDLETYRRPFWHSTVIVDETMMVISNEEQNSATLLFPAMEITTVRSTDHRVNYFRVKIGYLKKVS